MRDCDVCAVVSTVAGGFTGYSGTYADGLGSNAGFFEPNGVAVNARGDIFVADRINQRIRKITPDAGTMFSCFCLFARHTIPGLVFSHVNTDGTVY
jgi:hypothetical protein